MAGNRDTIEEKIKDILIKWIKEEHPTMSDVERMQFSKFGRALALEFPSCSDKVIEIGDLITPMMQEYQEICKTIKDTRVPAIVVVGDPELLPVLFERINSKGTQLNKYQIYAATWMNETFLIDDPELEAIVKANRDRYDSMLDNTGKLDDYDSVEFMNNKKLSAFETALGFGKMLCEKYPHLFGASTDPTKIESIGFNLINVCLCEKNSQAKTMNISLMNKVGDEICSFLKCIIQSIDIVDGNVGKYNKFKSNSRQKTANPLHTEMQITSMIAGVFLSRYVDIAYDEDGNLCDVTYHFERVNREWGASLKDRFKRNAAKIYIMDVLQRKWAGSGDKRLDQIITAPDIYCRTVDRKDFEIVLDNWNKQLNDERMEISRVTSPKEQELLMLAVVYLSSFTAEQQIDSSKYDVEHLATKKLMKIQLDRFEAHLKLPISSFGNLCLLPEYENRSKGEKTIYDDSDYLSKSDLTIETVERLYSFTTKEDLEWIHDELLTEEELATTYLEFVNKRYEVMKGKVLNKYDSI